ncbi:MAG: hypothetical protein ACP5KX_07555 [Caldisericia bacterium]
MRKSNIYILFNKKAQITISILLIFMIITSVFSVILYSSVEANEGYIFRNNLDFAVLSAGSTLSKGINIYSSLTVTRLTLYMISNILWLIPFFSPEKIGIIKNICDNIKNVSKILGDVQHYIPSIYLIGGMIVGNLNYNENNKEFNAIIIPNYFLGKIINPKEGEELLNLEDLIKIENFYEIFTSGYTGIGLRKKNFVEKIRNIFNINKKTIFDDYELFINSSEIYKRTKNEYAILDLSVVINLDKILTGWENKNLEYISNEIASEYEQRVKPIYECLINSLRDGNTKRGCMINKSLKDLIEGSEDLKNKIDEFKNCLSQLNNIATSEKIKYTNLLNDELSKEEPDQDLISYYRSQIQYFQNIIDGIPSLYQKLEDLRKQLNENILFNNYGTATSTLNDINSILAKLNDDSEKTTNIAYGLFNEVNTLNNNINYLTSLINDIITKCSNINYNSVLKNIIDYLSKFLLNPIKPAKDEIESLNYKFNILKGNISCYKTKVKNIIIDSLEIGKFINLFSNYNFSSENDDSNFLSFIDAIGSIFSFNIDDEKIDKKEEEDIKNKINNFIGFAKSLKDTFINLITGKSNLYSYYSPQLSLNMPKEIIAKIYKSIPDEILYFDSTIEKNLDDLKNALLLINPNNFNSLKDIFIGDQENSLKNKINTKFKNVEEDFKTIVKKLTEDAIKASLLGVAAGIIKSVLSGGTLVIKEIIENVVQTAVIAVVTDLITTKIQSTINEYTSEFFNNIISLATNNLFKNKEFNDFISNLFELFNNNVVIDYLKDFKYFPVTSISYNFSIYEFYIPKRRLRLCMAKVLLQ